MYIERYLNLEEALMKKSHFLLGPRQTGKTSLIRHCLSSYRVYNLLDSETFLKLSHSPSRLREECLPGEKIVVIDEIQKLPTLLDEVQLLIEEKGIHVLLTGSSARKLHGGMVNLLGGRARILHLHPLTSHELADQFDLKRALRYGLLPYIYFSQEPEEDLAAYAGTYLKEEIAAEGLTRNLSAFSRFLQVASLCNGRILNYTKVANDAQVPRTTVHEYFQILKDTLIGFELESWRLGSKRKALSTSKFYFFDTGIVSYLQKRQHVEEGTSEYGFLLETFLFHELKAYADYMRNTDLHYWRSHSGLEVDFVLDNRIGIELKASYNVASQDLKGLKALRAESGIERCLLVCFEKTRRFVDGIEILPLENFLKALWMKEYAAPSDEP